MNFKHALIPVIAGIVFVVGCESKPKNLIPTAVPAAIKPGEEHRVIDWLRYVGVRKDAKAVSAISISGIDSKVAGWDNYRWLHQHAGSVGQSLTEQEITAFGLADLKNLGILAPGVSKKDYQDAQLKLAEKKIPALPNEMATLSEIALDELPGATDKNRSVEYDALKNLQGAIGDAGVYRIAAAMPESVWNKVTIQAVKAQPTNAAFQDVFIQMGTKLVLQVTMTKRTDGNMGIVFARYSVGGSTFKKWDEALKAGAEVK